MPILAAVTLALALLLWLAPSVDPIPHLRVSEGSARVVSEGALPADIPTVELRFPPSEDSSPEAM